MRAVVKGSRMQIGIRLPRGKGLLASKSIEEGSNAQTSMNTKEVDQMNFLNVFLSLSSTS